MKATDGDNSMNFLEQLKQALEINNVINQLNSGTTLTPAIESKTTGLNCMIGKKVIIRTYSAGVWFGELEQKDGNEVILKNGRRMWKWWAKESISLSAVAKYGIKQDQSKICAPVDVWLEAIEIIPCSDEAIELIEGSENVEAE